ncbi:MAG: hypothetical protein LBN93_12170 [Candidatus Symbiothrix sp.]|jgi:hypothetical protein|nr:hypothetical protein [Candidatus Symbiothrix sp.]
MKTKALITTGLLLLSFDSFSQEQELNLKELEIPTSPAFILLDKAPTTIESPNTGKAFIVSAINAVSEADGIPKNYAVELTPFWFFKNPNMTAYKYFGYNPETKKQTIWKDISKASFSVAFVSEQDSINNVNLSNVAVGGRTRILSTWNKKDIADYNLVNDSLISFLESRDERMSQEIPDSLAWSNREEYNKRVAEFLERDAYDPILLKLKDDLNHILNRRPLFAIDAAIAYNHVFLDNSFDNNRFGRFGAWLTTSYSQVLDKNNGNQMYLNFYALGRYLRDGTTVENEQYIRQNYFDLGGKIEYEYKKIAVAYEYIYRLNKVENTFRSAGILKYKLMDQLAITCSFGKNFGAENNLVAFLGLNWGLNFGSEQVKLK